MLQDSYLALVEDTSGLPQIDLMQLSSEDRLVVETRRGLYELVLAVLNIRNDPPLWIAQTQGLDWLKNRWYALIGANTNYHQLSARTEIPMAAVQLNRVIRGYPMVLGDMHDSCVVMGPVDHVWHNSVKRF